ncbi:CdaR family transcriptional regulator [Bacillus marinisedimentorum]|uniref:CdaR family transcriptional regulator n=1 Tax=Bacillus marinisedimentorum TaxID=1821260 RepID=UPI000872CF81|nr:sugar diacid recognition domain-containing protein [Bacillus marinisedimentorum]
MLMPEMAGKIVYEVRKLIDEQVLITDVHGIIMASTDKSRIGNFHEGAKIASEKEEVLIISKSDESRLKGVKAGMNLPVFFNGSVIGVIGITGEPGKVTPYGELVRKMTELLLQENYYYEQIDWRARTLEAYVFDWIQQRDASSSFYNRGEFLGIDLEKDRACVLIKIPQDEQLMDRNFWSFVTRWLEQAPDDVLVRWGTDRFVFLKEADPSSPFRKNALRDSLVKLQRLIYERFGVLITAGVGSVSRSSEMRKSFTQAERALAVAEEKGTIIFEEELQLEIVLQDITSDSREVFLKRTIKPLLCELELLDTLKAFFEQDQSLKKTASAQHIHINTLHYRLKRIEEVTGLNPRRSKDFVTLYIAMLLLDE